MSSICNKVSMRGFYSKSDSQGYIKALIITVDGESGSRHEKKHPNSPFYAPFSFKRESYQLHHEEAVMAFDVTSSYVSVFKYQWELRPLKIPEYERERMGFLFRKIEGSLEKLVREAVPLSEKSSKSRGKVLGIFPTPLREKFNEADCYGTIGAGVCFNVYVEDLPSRKGEFKTSHQPGSASVSGFSPHFNPRGR